MNKSRGIGKRVNGMKINERVWNKIEVK